MIILFQLSLTFSSALAEDFAPLSGNHVAGPAGLATSSAPPPYQPLQMEIYLKPRDQAGLDRLSQEQQDPASAQYHKWLTPDEYAQQFGPSGTDVAQVAQWLTREGFTVTHADAHDGRIVFSGDVGRAQTAFLVHIAASRDGKSFGNVEDPQVPASLAPKISYVSGLDNLNDTIWHTVIKDPPYINNGITSPHFGPADIKTFNNEGPLLGAGLDGTGQCIAVSEGSDVDPPSLDQFNTVFGLPAFTPSNFFSKFPDGPPGPPGSEDGGESYGEAVLDVEYAHGIAPGATIGLYAVNAGQSASNPAQGLVDTISAIVNDKTHNCQSVAVSWAQCGEPTAFYTNLSLLFQQGATEGKSIFVASGDDGTAPKNPFSCALATKSSKNIEENAGSPFVTAVGASMFQANYDSNGDDTSTDANTTQSVWDIDLNIANFFVLLAGSTGGYSRVFPKPSWQNGVGGISGKFRAVPHLVLGGGKLGGKLISTTVKGKPKLTGKDFPAPGFWECYDGGLALSGSSTEVQWSITGGTSIVPPQYAAILAIINQKTSAAGGQGLINPKLYAMAQANLKNLKKVGIYDIVTGNNAVPPVPGYSAKKGYDLASGWGAIDFTQFVNSFVSFVPPPPRKK